jgi:hypothetical protein
MSNTRREPVAGSTTTHPLHPAILFAALALGCGRAPDVVEIAGERTAASPSIRVLRGASVAQRFGGGMAPPRDTPPAPSGFEFDMPAGWETLPASSMRPVNLQPAGHPDAECYVTLLSGDGGGLVSNVDRWRKQLGLEPMAPGEAEALPDVPLLGALAKLVEVEGAYTGMGDAAQPGWKLLGAVLLRADSAVFVKLTGPAEVVDSEREGFLTFCASLRESASAGGTGGGVAAGGASAAGPGPGAGAESTGPFDWQVPEGWSVGEPRPMRLVSFDIGEDSECYVTLLAGDGGGLVANVDRWRRELGLEPSAPEDLEGLPRHTMLGREAVLFEGQGTYSSMGGAARDDHAVLGAICLRGADSVFVKMIGPSEEVLARRDDFLGFLSSLEEVAR